LWRGGHTNNISFWILKWCMITELGKICTFCWGNIFVECEITTWQPRKNVLSFSV
jgi:hypothetical protein